MPPRPYSRLHIEELERLFESSKQDVQKLSVLEEELTHRQTKRAKSLGTKVDQCLAQHRHKKPDRQTNSPKPNRSTDNNAPNPEPEAIVQDQIMVPPPHYETHEPKFTPIPKQEAVRDMRIQSGPKFGPDAILTSWLTLEVLTPQPMPNERDLEAAGSQLVRLEQVPEPWLQPTFKRRGRERYLYWMVYLGELDLAKAVQSIIDRFPDDSQERSQVQGTSALAVVVLDADGKVVVDRTFLSSFAWGYGKVRADQFRELAKFVEYEHAITVALERRLRRQDENGQILPLGASDISQAINWLVAELNLPDEEIIRPGIALRVPQWGLYSEPPQPELLNSFFIEDLVRVRSAFKEGDIGQAIQAYINAIPSRERQDVVGNSSLLSATLSPSRIPLSRWPGPGRHPLVFMQQAAINHAVSELVNPGLVSVNGPPGTGKSTLLRDIVAKVVLDRAIALSEFPKPEEAFTHVTSMRTGQAYSHLYQLHESLLGHEIVVASSNNKAVENISREIPSSSAIANDSNPPLRYFQSVSDAVLANDGQIVEGATWGLAAAVLGNASNRAAFAKTFWWHKKRGMALYFKAVTGRDIAQDREENNEEDNNDIIRDVIDIEQPPRSEIEAYHRWQEARKDFLAKLRAVKLIQQRMDEAYQAVCRRHQLEKEADIAHRAFADAQKDLTVRLQQDTEARAACEAAIETERKASQDRDALTLLRPGFFARLFYTRTYREWRHRMSKATQELDTARSLVRVRDEAAQRTSQILSASRGRLAQAEAASVSANDILRATLATIEAGQATFGSNFADEEFWNQEDCSLQTTSPWICNDFQRARDDLFAASFALHRAFIDAAAKYLRHNVRAALDVMKGRSLSETQEPARRSLWASLFLLVPVVSTTFASMSRLFGPLGREQLGWLLIDEAGQAVPQAAAGALWRAKRAIVIGDPLQIQPVVIVPPKLIDAIFAEFGVSSGEWAAPEMSAQTLSDRASWFGTTIQTKDGDIWVGSPLRVHRRCEEPMFSISNYIAYDGLMVFGTSHGESAIGNVLGPSFWIDVQGDGEGKWSQAEGEQALQLLSRLLHSGIDDPDIFFITPFRIVSQKLREIIRRDDGISRRLPENARTWTASRIGTIHTFQGKEAEAVVLVLGAPLDISASARQWAGHPPNLLNVAVTRAKHRLYVIGDRTAWRNAGSFTHLAQVLPVSKIG
ncbi:MAG: hypothetical protein CAF44_001990 [Nitrospira sp. CG24D]|nr:MAG: hypothetical protein CAF44_001990 [Nitrospira sp. CG24D]